MGKGRTDPHINLPNVLSTDKKVWAFVLLTAIFCSPAPNPVPPAFPYDPKNRSTENILRYDVTAPLVSLDPAEVDSGGSTLVFPLLYSYLFVLGDDGELEPDLAERWSLDPGKMQWTIYLRDDALFHNNQPVTAKDVQYSLEKFIKALRPVLVSAIKRISVLSDTTLCIHLRKEDPLILHKIWDFEIFPKPDGQEVDYYHHPIGSGPFKFKSRQGDREVSLDANEGYYAGRPALDQIVFFYQPDRERTWTRLLAGETDIAQEVSPKNYQIMRNYEDQFYFDRYTMRYYTILLYNTYDPLFLDPKVRRALSHGIDREYIVNNILNGYGSVANGPMGVDSPFHNPGLKPLLFDPQKAMALLEEAGWSYDSEARRLYKDGIPFEFSILVSKESQVEKKVARYIQLCLNNLGIRAGIQALRFEALQKKCVKNTRFQAVITELQGAYRKPEVLICYWVPGSKSPSIAGCFDHPEVTRLIKTCFETKDPKIRKELYYEIDAQIASLQPGTFLFQKTAIDLMSKRFWLPQAFSLTHEGIHRLRHAILIEK